MPDTRDQVWDRVTIDYAIRGTSRITWSLKPRFVEQGPYVFQLQASRVGGEDWSNVGTNQTNSYYALDDERRLYGQDRRLTYRVQLTTDVASYTSPEATVLGRLSRRQWLQAREIIRQLSIESRGMESFAGWLFKRRIAGQRCTCVDSLMDGVRNSDHALCKGTGFIDGYFLAAPLDMYDLSPKVRETHNRGQVGTTTDMTVPARFVGLPQVHNRDIWVSQHNDERFYIHKVVHLSEMNQVPLAVEAELKPAEHSDIAYALEVPE